MLKKRAKKAIAEELKKQEEEEKTQYEQDQALFEAIQAKKAIEIQEINEQLENWKKALTERREETQKQVNKIVVERRTSLFESQEERRKEEEWKIFIECDHFQKIDGEAKIYSFIESYNETPVNDVPAALLLCDNIERVQENIVRILHEARLERDQKKIEEHQKFLEDLHQLRVRKIDEALSYLSHQIFTQENIDIPQLPVILQTPNFVYTNGAIQCSWRNRNDTIQVFIWILISASKIFRPRLIDYSEIGYQIEIPKGIINATYPLRPLVRGIHFNQYYPSLLRSRLPEISINGILLVELATLPQQMIKTKNNWMLQNVTEKKERVLSILPYPNSDTKDVVSQNVLVKFDYKIPSSVLIANVPKMKLWSNDFQNAYDMKQGIWVENYMDENLWDSSKKKLFFSTSTLGVMAATIDRHILLPYEWWYLKCCSASSAILKVKTTKSLLVFFINNEGVSLEAPNTISLKRFTSEQFQEILKDTTNQFKEQITQVTTKKFLKENLVFDDPETKGENKKNNAAPSSPSPSSPSPSPSPSPSSPSPFPPSPPSNDLLAKNKNRNIPTIKNIILENFQNPNRTVLSPFSLAIDKYENVLSNEESLVDGANEAPNRNKTLRRRGVVFSPPELLFELRKVGLNILPEDGDIELILEDVCMEMDETKTLEADSSARNAERKESDESDDREERRERKVQVFKKFSPPPERIHTKEPVIGIDSDQLTDTMRELIIKTDHVHKGSPGAAFFSRVKSRAVEENACRQMATLSSACDISSHSLNKFAPADIALFQICNNPFFESFDLDSLEYQPYFRTMVCGSDSVGFAVAKDLNNGEKREEEGREEGKGLYYTSPDPLIPSVFSQSGAKIAVSPAVGKGLESDVSLCFTTDVLDEEVTQRLTDHSNALFRENVRQMFLLLRLLSFG